MVNDCLHPGPNKPRMAKAVLGFLFAGANAQFPGPDLPFPPMPSEALDEGLLFSQV